MRRLLFSTTALVFLSLPVFAQPPGHDNDQGHSDRGQAQSRQGPPEQHGGFDRGNHGPAPQASVQPNHDQMRGDRGRGDHGPAPQAAIQAAPNRDRGDQNRGERGDWRNDRGPRPQASLQAVQPAPQVHRDDRNDRRAFNDNRNDNRAGVNRDFNRDGRTDYRGQRSGARHDFSGFRDFHRSFQASRRFRAPDYRRPAGWYPHHWTFGAFLPAAFWVRDYWLLDFVDYDLPPPPYGAVWVRVDHDALLIDEDSGEIITVEYDVFY